MPTRMYVITHKQLSLPSDDYFYPIQVGRAINDELPYTGDNTGDNISDKNKSYCELTGIYWIWKNSQFDGNIGICQYRRYFVDKFDRFLGEKECDKILSEYDIITSTKYAENETEDVFCLYSMYHNGQDILKIGDVIKNLYPDDYTSYIKVISDKDCALCNMMVASRELYNEYCEWLFPILFTFEKDINTDSYDEYNKRVFGFLAERLLNVFVEARRLKVYRCTMIQLMDEMESSEIISHIKKMYDIKMYAEGSKFAGDYINSCLNNRKPIFDVNMTLVGAQYMMSMMAYEKMKKIKYLESYSNDFYKLCSYVMEIRSYIKMAAEGMLERDGQKIINDMNKDLLLKYIAVIYSEEDMQIQTLVNIAMCNYRYGNNICIIPFFEDALAINENSEYAIKNLIPILKIFGENKLAEEYENKLK